MKLTKLLTLSILFAFINIFMLGCNNGSGTTFSPNSNNNDITSFSLKDNNGNLIGGTVSGTNIDVKMPSGTNVTGLIATFITGVNSIVTVNNIEQQSGITENDFTSDVIYTVTGGDNTVKIYTVSAAVSGSLRFTDESGNAGKTIKGYAISTDSSNNIYVTGITDGGISGETQQGLNDYFIAKYDTDNNLVWTKQVGATGGVTFGNGVSADSMGNIYVTGTTNGGISGQTQNGSYDYFIAKYGTGGNLLWTKQVGATGGETTGNGVSTDSMGNIYVAGYTNKGISGQTQQGDYDYFIAKYGTGGNLLWTKQVGTTGGGGDTSGYGVSTDSMGNIYLTGYTHKGISGQTQNGSYDYFIAKYNTGGNLLWTKQVGATGGSGDTYGYGVSTDSMGYIYVTGSTNKEISGQTQQGDYDYFIARYDTSGNLLWTKQVGCALKNTEGFGVSADSIGNSYVTGYTTGGISGQTQQGLNDYFIAKYDILGTLVWTKQVGATGGVTIGTGISLDSIDNLYVAGYTNVGISGQTQQGTYDYFIAKYVD